MSDLNDKIEPTLELEPEAETPASIEYDQDYYIYRVDLDPAKASMGAMPLPTGLTFPRVEYEGDTFYRIEGKYWRLSHLGSDDLGIFACFYKVAGEFKGY